MQLSNFLASAACQPKTEKKVFSVYIVQWRRKKTTILGLILHTSLCVSRHQTMVQMVLRLGSKRTTFPSAAFVFVLYMGFSNVACPLLFSWTEHPVYWALSVFLWNKKQKDRRPINSLYFPSHASIILVWTAAKGKWGCEVIVGEKSSASSPCAISGVANILWANFACHRVCTCELFRELMATNKTKCLPAHAAHEPSAKYIQH